MIKPLNERSIDLLKTTLIEGSDRQRAVATTVGGATLCDGVIRLFSSEYPFKLGVQGWNSSTGWRSAWPKLDANFHFFGEDLWGNQFALANSTSNVLLWNHEDSTNLDTALEIVDFIEAVMKYGLTWTDYYTGEMLQIANTLKSKVADETHLHWTTPLILGGAVAPENISVVERVSHLRGHGKLWQQMEGLASGTEVIGR